MAGGRARRASPRRARRRLHVLVTNDDGVDAPGLDAIATLLAAEPSIALTVCAPITNQTGASATLTTGPLGIVSAETASGHPATAVAGTPADAVVFAVRQLLEAPPDLVVSGLNAGPNLAEFIGVSGTVSAALAAARLGIPAIAASQGLAATIDYAALADFVAGIVRRFRTSSVFRQRMMLLGRPRTGVVLNVNFPSCARGRLRGVRVVPLGRVVDVTGYVRVGEGDALASYQPTLLVGDITHTDCTSTLTAPANDLEAFNHGFASVTPLVPDVTLAAALGRFRWLERSATR